MSGTDRETQRERERERDMERKTDKGTESREHQWLETRQVPDTY